MDDERFPGKIVFDPPEPDRKVVVEPAVRDRDAEAAEQPVSHRLPVLVRQPPDESRSYGSMVATAVTIGLVALVAVWYLPGATQTGPAEMTAYCVDQQDMLADQESVCDEEYVTSQGGYYSNGTFFLPPANGFGSTQYHYYYGGGVGPDRRVFGGSITAPPDFTEVKTASGKTVQRGGFGSSAGKSGGS